MYRLPFRQRVCSVTLEPEIELTIVVAAGRAVPLLDPWLPTRGGQAHGRHTAGSGLQTNDPYVVGGIVHQIEPPWRSARSAFGAMLPLHAGCRDRRGG